MNYNKNDTIASIITPSGRSGIGVIRISGSQVSVILRLTDNKKLIPWHGTLVNLSDRNKNPLDQAILLFFRGPYSYTAEDVIELQLHGNQVILERVLREIIAMEEIRLAEPGEFTLRAYLNGRIDLVQAEAVADLINASSEEAAEASLRSLQGTFSNRLNQIQEAIRNLRINLEVVLNFPEESSQLETESIPVILKKVIDDFKRLLSQAEQGLRLNRTRKILIVGPPNSGKSTLFNRLTESEGAIVTSIPGTTTDLIQQRMEIRGVAITIVDTAGLRETSNPIEIEGIKRARDMTKEAEHIYYVIEEDSDFSKQKIAKDLKLSLEDNRITVVRNKIDLRSSKIDSKELIKLSAKSGRGINLLIADIEKRLALKSKDSSQFIARQRHIIALKGALKSLQRAYQIYLEKKEMIELIAEEVDLAEKHIGSIIGQTSSDELLHQIFSKFCIGK